MMGKKVNKIREFEADLDLYWHCEGRNHLAVGQLCVALSYERHPIMLAEFNQILDEAICTKRYSVEKYEALTGLDFGTVDEVVDDLKVLREALRGR